MLQMQWWVLSPSIAHQVLIGFTLAPNSTMVDASPDGTVVPIDTHHRWSVITLQILSLPGLTQTIHCKPLPKLPPSLLQFTTLGSSDSMSLRVDIDSFNETDITLQSKETRDSTTAIVMLTGETAELMGTSQVQLQLLTDTFIVLLETVIADSSCTLLVPVTENVPQMAAGLVLDTSPPNLVDFDLDKENGILLLCFSEIVITTGFTVRSLEFQEASSSPCCNVSFTTSTFSGNMTDNITVMLSIVELETINLWPLCTGSANCYITIRAAVVLDLLRYPNPAR